jgi:NAD(P)-dependent dehydrogenase (short-subunit alcohol dehydrogenase family)
MSALTGKVAVISGASSPTGIGRATAKRFAQAGASVLLVAEGPADQLEAGARECRELGAPRAESVVIDLTEPDGAERMIAHAEKLFGRVDVLMNNAALRADMNFGEYTHEQFDRLVSVNLASPFFASQAVLPMMRRQGGGRIIHTASQLGHVTFDKRALYGLTKAALIHLTKSMAYELGRENIIVNAISPGPIETGRSLNRTAEATKRLMDKVPAGRFGEPEEIADVAFYLATAAPAFLQGQAIVVDGGFIIH